MYFGAVKAGVVARPRLTGACDAFPTSLHPMRDSLLALFFTCETSGLLYHPSSSRMWRPSGECRTTLKQPLIDLRLTHGTGCSSVASKLFPYAVHDFTAEELTPAHYSHGQLAVRFEGSLIHDERRCSHTDKKPRLHSSRLSLQASQHVDIFYDMGTQLQRDLSITQSRNATGTPQ